MLDNPNTIDEINGKNIWSRMNTTNTRVILISLFFVVLIQGTLSKQPFDDAYITFRYARNISKGFGFVYNQGESVLGTTTPLYTLLLAFIAHLTQPQFLPKASFIISILADTLNIWLIYRLTNWILKDHVIAIITSAVFLLQPFRLNVAAGGMETSLFITSLLLSYDRYLVGERSLSTSVWAAIALLIRPDAAIALFPIFIDWLVCDQRGFLKGILITGLLISPWIIWSTFNFGSPLPHSIIAKSISYKNPLGQAVFYLLTFFGTGTPGPYPSLYFLLPGLLFGLPVLLFGIWMLVKNHPRGLVMGLYPILYAGLMASLNPSMYFSWYFIPLMPGMLILMMASIWFGLKKPRKTRLVVASVLSLFLLVFPTYLLNKHPNWPLSRSRETAFWDVCNILSSTDFREKVVLATDIGVLGWCLEEANILDPIGLVSPDSIKYNRDLPPEQLVSLKLISDKKPDYLISLDQFINPYVIGNGDFLKAYNLIYEMNVKIVQTDQPLYVFRRDSDF